MISEGLMLKIAARGGPCLGGSHMAFLVLLFYMPLRVMIKGAPFGKLH